MRACLCVRACVRACVKLSHRGQRTQAHTHPHTQTNTLSDNTHAHARAGTPHIHTHTQPHTRTHGPTAHTRTHTHTHRHTRTHTAHTKQQFPARPTCFRSPTSNLFSTAVLHSFPPLPTRSRTERRRTHARTYAHGQPIPTKHRMRPAGPRTVSVCLLVISRRSLDKSTPVLGYIELCTLMMFGRL